MTELMQQILAAKAENRKRLAALPFEEKLVLMERMRDRGRLIAAARQKLRENQHHSTPVQSPEGQLVRDVQAVEEGVGGKAEDQRAASGG